MFPKKKSFCLRKVECFPKMYFEQENKLVNCINMYIYEKTYYHTKTPQPKVVERVKDNK